MGQFLSFGKGMNTYQARMNHVHDSTREKQERTTQYMSHGVNWAGSEVRRALYEAKIGKRMVMMDLKMSVQCLERLCKLWHEAGQWWGGGVLLGSWCLTYESRFGMISNRPMISYRPQYRRRGRVLSINQPFEERSSMEVGW